MNNIGKPPMPREVWEAVQRCESSISIADRDAPILAKYLRENFSEPKPEKLTPEIIVAGFTKIWRQGNSLAEMKVFLEPQITRYGIEQRIAALELVNARVMPGITMRQTIHSMRQIIHGDIATLKAELERVK